MIRISEYTDEELERIAADCLKRADYASHYGVPGVKASQQARAAVFQELLDRRREDALRIRSAPAIKLAIAHVEMLRDKAVANKQTAAVACLEMQLSILKDFDQ